jgi:hypothetical protein
MNPAIQSLFISSTSLDLAEEREAVSKMLRGLRESGFLGREHFGGRETPGRRTSLEDIEKSQLFILMLGGLYGSGVIEDEYRRARDRGLPCLIYFKDEEARETDPERAQRLKTFKDVLLLQHTTERIELFSCPEELSRRMRNDLFRWYFDSHLTYYCANTAIGSINITIEEKPDYRLEAGSEHGAIVYARQTSPESPITAPSATESASSGLIGREAETAAAEQAVEQGVPVVLYGPAGAGKSAMLDALAALADGSLQRQFPDGIVRIEGTVLRGLNDLLQTLFHVFYEESDAPRKTTAADPERLLCDQCALVLLDGVEIADEDLACAVEMLPACAFAVTADHPRLAGMARQVELRGLAPEKALELLAREMGRALKPEETAFARQLCERLEGNPRWILVAASLIKEEPFVLTALAGMESLRDLIEWVHSRALGSLTEHEKRVMALLGAANGASLAARTVSTLTGIPGIAPILESLCRRWLIETRGDRHRLAESLQDYLPQVWDLSDWRQRIFDHVTQWVEEHHRNPKRVREAWPVAFAMPDWARAAGRAPEIIRLGLALDPSLVLAGHWDLWAASLQKILLAARLEDDGRREAWALHQLGTRAFCLGEADDARRLLSEALDLRVELGEHSAAAVTRHNLDFLLPREAAASRVGAAEPVVEAATTDPFPDAPVFDAEIMLPPDDEPDDGEIAPKRIEVIPFIYSRTKPLSAGTRRLAWLSHPSRRLAAVAVALLVLVVGGGAIARFRSRPVSPARAAVSPSPESPALIAPLPPVAPLPPISTDPSPSPAASPTPPPALNVPQLIVSTDILTFEPVEQGKMARARLAIKNESAVPLVISDLRLIGVNAGDFKVARDCSRRIGAKGDCTLDLEFTPQQPGGREAALMIASNAGAPRYVALKGAGTALAPRLEAAPAKVDFGLSVSRVSGNQEIVSFRNSGAGPLTITSISLTEADVFVYNDINCRGRDLAPGDSCSLSLSFRAKKDGDYSASLIIQSNASNNPLTVPIEGRRQLIANRTPTLAVFPTQLRMSFTGQAASDRKLTRGLIRLSNQGEVPLTINDVGMDGPHPTSFQLSHKCKGAQLAPGSQCDIEVVFAPGPAMVTEHRARVLVTLQEGATPQSVILNGSVSAPR